MKHGKIVLKMALIGAVAGLCMAASGGCGSDLHKASVAAGTISTTLKAAATANHAYSGESADDKKFVAGLIIDAATANDSFVDTLTMIANSGGILTGVDAENAFSALTTKLNKLNDQGLLHLKSAKAQADFKLTMSIIQAQVTILQSLQTPATTSKRDGSAGSVATAGVVFTGAEIEELIVLAVGAGSAIVGKLMELKGQSDGEILAGAKADDAEAIAIAEGDLGSEPAGAPGEAPAPVETEEPEGDGEVAEDENKS